MQEFYLKKLSIDEPPFRKLKKIEIEFSKRITLIAGHNGIGKSTILALIANGSGLTKSDLISYTDRTFQGNLNEIIHIEYTSELEEKKALGLLPQPLLTYELNGYPLVKRCALTKRTLTNHRVEARVVPRNFPIKEFQAPDSEVVVGVAGKVPIPTIYLGMTRMLPIGESDPDLIENMIDTGIDPKDADFIAEFVNQVIGVNAAQGQKKSITTQSIKGTKKRSMHPAYNHSPKTVSLGQDSLSAIATALASFKKLDREWGDYPGGLLVIDEIDAGFHPHAQKKLIQAIANSAKKFRIQVVATTHSLCLIESIHPDSNPIGGKGAHIDSVIYIKDTMRPKASNASLDDIRNDMNLTPPKAKPIEKSTNKKIKVYLEDAEANIFLKPMLTRRLLRKVKLACGYSLLPIPISVGCDNLQGLQKFDPHFKTVIFAIDADSTLRNGKGRGSVKNVVKLPGGEDGEGRGFNPERTIYTFVQELIADNDKYPTSRAYLEDLGVTSDQLHNYLIDGEANISKRTSAKKWMNARLEYINDWNLIPLWLEEHPEKVAKFEEELIAAAEATAKLLG